jgi:hypothetical protein
MLEFMERAWLQSKDPFAIIEGIEICQTRRQPLAEWLHNATLAAISKQIPPVEVRHHRERVMHYTRWWLVRELGRVTKPTPHHGGCLANLLAQQISQLTCPPSGFHSTI